MKKEKKGGVEEYRRVLASYGRSSHVAETLKRIAEVEELLDQAQEAEKHRHMLLSLFPQSPAAKALLASTPAPAGNEAARGGGEPQGAPIDMVPEPQTIMEAPETAPETAEPEH